MASEGYDPAKSRVAEDSLAAWLTAPITGDLEEVPGVGPSNARSLAAAGVETTFQLIGKFLSFRSSDVDTADHCNAFWAWLKSVGVNSYRSGITNAIAEKTNLFMPGVYVWDD